MGAAKDLVSEYPLFVSDDKSVRLPINRMRGGNNEDEESVELKGDRNKLIELSEERAFPVVRQAGNARLFL